MSEICQIAGYPPSVAGTEGRGHPLPHLPSKPRPVCTADNPRSSARAANGKMRAKFGFPMAKNRLKTDVVQWWTPIVEFPWDIFLMAAPYRACIRSRSCSEEH